MNKQNNLFNKENITMLLAGTFLAFLADKFLNPVFSYLYSLLINTGVGIVRNISDSTYKQISNGYTEQSATMILTFLCIAILEIPLIIYMKYPDTLKEKEYAIDYSSDDSRLTISKIKAEIREARHKIKLYYFGTLICSVILSLSVMFMYARLVFIQREIFTLTNNIEIVSPYISDIEYKTLKSDFHLMENHEDYNQLIFRLQKFADDNSLKLKK